MFELFFTDYMTLQIRVIFNIKFLITRCAISKYLRKSDYVDLYWVQEIWRLPTRYIIYQCIRNLTEGLSLYLIVLLLSHLSDFQHRGSWLWLIAMVILVPLVFSVVLLVAQLFLPHAGCKQFDELGNEVQSQFTRESFVVTTAAETIKVAFYNVATTILLFVFSRR